MGFFSKLGKNQKNQQNINYNQLPLYCCAGNMLHGAPSPLHGLRRPPACKGALAMLAMCCDALTLPLLPKNPPACKGGSPLHCCTGKAPLLLFGGGRNPPVCKGHYPSIAALATCCKALLPLKNIHYNQQPTLTPTPTPMPMPTPTPRLKLALKTKSKYGIFFKNGIKSKNSTMVTSKPKLQSTPTLRLHPHLPPTATPISTPPPTATHSYSFTHTI